LQHQVDAANPLGRLPKVQMGHQQPSRSTVLRGQLLALILISNPCLTVEQILQRQVGAVTPVTVDQRKIRLGLDVGQQGVE
jgi:hypothetical protein